MKTISKFILAILLVSFMTVACDDMNSIIQDDLDKGEAIYPGRINYNRLYDVEVGIGRVWVYWAISPDVRVDKTIISYTFNGETQSVEKAVSEGTKSSRIDSLEITGLDEGYYSFSASTVDKDGNRSIKRILYGRAGNVGEDEGLTEVVQVYGDIYLNSLSARSIEKMEILPGGDLQISWANDTNNVLYTVVEYRDHSSVPSGKPALDTVSNKTPASELQGFKRFRTFSVKSYRQVGIDVAPIEDLYVPPVAEKALLETAPNDFTELTEEKANTITELTYPIGMAGWTLQDLYYFPNLRTLDLTPGTLNLPGFRYDNYYTDARDTDEGRVYDTAKYVAAGGDCPWLNFASGYMSDSDIAIIGDLLESGQLTEVRYTRNSYPRLDAVLEPYGSRIKWTSPPLPDYGIMIPPSLLADYRVVDRDRGVNIKANNPNTVMLDHKEDGSNVSGTIKGLFDGDLNNVYRVRINCRLSAEQDGKIPATNIAFALPEGFQFGMEPHGRLMFDCYVETQNDWLVPAGISKFEGWAKVKVLISRKMPGNFEDTPYVEADFPYNTPYRGETLEYPRTADANNKGYNIAVGKWTTFEWDCRQYLREGQEAEAGTMVPDNELFRGHYRVIRIQLGADGMGWPLPSGKSLTYYIANLRWAK
jgi:hypothetical protein